MKALKLTKRQKEVYELMSNNPKGFLRKYIRPSGLICWRLLDENVNPIMNVTEGIVYSLLEKDVLQLDKSGQHYVLKADVGDKRPDIDLSKLGLPTLTE